MLYNRPHLSINTGIKCDTKSVEASSNITSNQILTYNKYKI